MRVRYKPKEHETALQNIKLLYKSRKKVIKLFYYYYSTIASEVKNKTIHR